MSDQLTRHPMAPIRVTLTTLASVVVGVLFFMGVATGSSQAAAIQQSCSPACLPTVLTSPSAARSRPTQRRSRNQAPKGIAPRKPILTATFNSIGIELPFTGDDNGDAAATVQFKKSTDTAWRNGLPLWEVATPTDGGQPAFYGSLVQLDPGTSYDVRIQVTDPDRVKGLGTITGTIATRSDNVAAAASLTPGYYVTANGSDTNSGTSPAQAWATLDKAVKSAPAGAVVQVGPGHFDRPYTTMTKPITFVAQYPSVDDNQNVINSGRHTIVSNGIYTAPTGSGQANSGVWKRVSIEGPGHAGARPGATYTIWAWTSTGVFAANYGPETLGYSTALDGEPTRLANWDLAGKGGDLSTVPGWVEKLYTNQTYNYGWHASDVEGTTWTVYLRMPGDLDPNDYYVFAGGMNRSSSVDGAAFLIDGDHVRVSGIEIRGAGVSLQADAHFGEIDHNLLEMASVGMGGSKPNNYGSDHVIEHNRIVDQGLWSADGKAIPWDFIKGDIENANDTAYSPGRIGQRNETAGIGGSGGAKRVVIRDNVIDGPFNGITFYNVGFDRYADQDLDVYNNLIEHTADDAIEPENQGINIRIWNNQIQNTLTALSTGPLAYGPVYFFRNQVWRTGGTGVGRDDDGTTSAGPVGFKYSGSSVPTARIYVINNTFWTDAPGVSGGDQYAGGGSNSEWFYLRNNIFAMSKYAFSAPTNTSPDSQWNEDYDYFYTNDPTRGMNYGSSNQSTVAQYRSATGQGDHANLSDTSGSFHTPPALSDPANGNLSLAAGSPQINVGAIVPNIADQPGVNFQGTAPDLGAIEAK